MGGVNIGLISAAPDVVEHPAFTRNHSRADVRSYVVIGVEPGACLRFRIARIELLQRIAPCRAINQAAVVGPARAIPVGKSGEVNRVAASSGTALVEMPGAEERDPLAIGR